MILQFSDYQLLLTSQLPLLQANHLIALLSDQLVMFHTVYDRTSEQHFCRFDGHKLPSGVLVILFKIQINLWHLCWHKWFLDEVLRHDDRLPSKELGVQVVT